MIGQTNFIRLLRKLATEREMRGETELRTWVYTKIRTPYLRSSSPLE